MSKWRKTVTATFVEEQNREKMRRWKAEQAAKRWYGCELCDGKVDENGVCRACGQIQGGD